MLYVIDRFEGAIAVCESLESGEKLQIMVRNLLSSASEGDVIRKAANGYIIDADATCQRKAELSDRLNRLYKRK